MITPIYRFSTMDLEDTDPYGGLLTDVIDQNWFSDNVMEESVFELAKHHLEVLDLDEKNVSGELLRDIYEVAPCLFSFSEEAWPLLSMLSANGCRIAENVEVLGPKKFKLVYPARVIDILDHEASEIVMLDYEKDGKPFLDISHVKNYCLFEDDGELPLMFQVLYKGPMRARPSLTVFVSQDFVDMYSELELSGAFFRDVRRSLRR